MTKRQVGGSIRRVETASGPRWRFRADLTPGPDGRRKQRTYTFRSEREAVEAQSRIRREVVEQTHVDRDRITVGQYLDQWLEAGARQWRPSTRDSYRRTLGQVRAHIGSTRLQHLDRLQIERMTSALLLSGGRAGTGRSPRTVQLILVVLTKALGDAVRDGLIMRNPAQYVRKPRVERHEHAVWSAEQIAHYLRHVDSDPLVGAWHLTMRGLRRGEVLGLRWRDVDFERRAVHVRHTRVAVAGQVVEGAPKTARGRRSIPMDAALERALRLSRERLVTSAVVRPFGDPGAAFVVVDRSGEPLLPSTYGAMFERLAAGAGLPRVRLHDARHSAITVLLEQGVPVHLVARFAGHDPAMTLRVYSHVTDKALEQAGEVFGSLYAAPAGQGL